LEEPEVPTEEVTLTIESWRNDDLAIWQDTIIPAFEAQYPNIKVEFAPTAPAEYNGVLNTMATCGRKVSNMAALAYLISKTLFKIRRNGDRRDALKKPCVIITTAGMLQGGPVGFYISKLHERVDCSMVMTGYQVDGTVGRTLLETGRYINEGIDVKPRFKLEFLDMSAHTDRSHLIDFYRRTRPGKIVLVHGDRTEEFAKELNGMGFDAVEIHFGHGYALSQFISPLTNKRKDEYGGTLSRRMRMPLETLEAVRAAVGDDFPILGKISMTDGVKGGVTYDEGVGSEEGGREEAIELLVQKIADGANSNW